MRGQVNDGISGMNGNDVIVLADGGTVSSVTGNVFGNVGNDIVLFNEGSIGGRIDAGTGDDCKLHIESVLGTCFQYKIIFNHCFCQLLLFVVRILARQVQKRCLVVTIMIVCLWLTRR